MAIDFAQYGSDQVSIAGDYGARVVRRTVVNNDNFAKRMVLRKGAIDRRCQKAVVVVVDYNDTDAKRVAHMSAHKAIGWRCQSKLTIAELAASALSILRHF